MPHDSTVGWNGPTQKLICMMVLDDDVARALCTKAGDAFFRAFIVEERETGDISCNFRFRYTDHDSWFQVAAKSEKKQQGRAQRVAELQEGMEHVIFQSLRLMSDMEPPRDIFTSYFPPDDEGDPCNTTAWLLDKDLVQITKIERL